jgi:ribosomal protein S18 acetylase RimI-like enzyme
MNPNVEVERLSEYSDDDAAGLGRLMPFLSDRFTDEPIRRELLEAIISSPNHEQLVARIESRIIGAATLSIVMGIGAGQKAYLEDFVTDPAIQRQGVGDKVWLEMMNWCGERGIDLEFTSSSNRVEAHNFYFKHGAHVRDTTVFHVDV